MSTLVCLFTLSCWLLASVRCSAHTRIYRSHRKIIASFETQSNRLDELVHSISVTRLLIDILDEEIEEMLDASSFWDSKEATVVVDKRCRALECFNIDQLESRTIERNLKAISRFRLRSILDYYRSLKISLSGKLKRARKRKDLKMIILLERRIEASIRHLALASRLLQSSQNIGT